MTRSRICCCVWCAVLVALAALMAFHAGAVAVRAADPPVSFIRDVAPILKDYCYACHDARKHSGKFELTSYATLRQGGSNEDPIVPGKPDESLLVQLLIAEGSRRMPPPPKDKITDKDGMLPDAKIRLIERWILEGAKLDAGIDPKANMMTELRRRFTPPVPPAAYAIPVMVTALAFSPDGSRLVASGHHELTVWDVASGKLVQRIRTRAERTYALLFLPDGTLIAAGGRPGQEGEVNAYNLQAPPTRTENGVAFLDGVDDPKVRVAHLLDTDDSVLCLALAAQGKKLAAGGCDRLVRVWDVSAGAAQAKLESTVENHADWVLGVALSAEGGKLLTAGRDKTAKIYDLVKKEPVFTVPDHQAVVNGVAIKSDGKVGYSVGADKNLRLWNVETGKAIRALGGHGEEVLRILNSPSAVLIATGSADKSVRLWKEDGSPKQTLSGLGDQVFSLAFSPNGALLAAGTWNGEIRVWKLADGSVLKAIQASPGYVAKPKP